MHAGEAVAEALREEGVERVYSVPGSHIHPIYDGLSRVRSIRMVTCKQEPNVSLMADAYGRLTGKPGVCVVTAGPGCVNSMAGVAQAYGAASPMVHISGAVPLKADLEAFHGVDDPAFVHEMFKKITKWSARIERIEDIPEVLAKAFHIARSGRPGPVHVELPRFADYSEYILQEAPAVLSAYQVIPTKAAALDSEDVERCAKRLMESRAPVIAAGKGVIRKGAMAELAELRERAPEKNILLFGFDDATNSRYRGEDQRVADPKLFLAGLLERLGDYRRPRDEALIKRMEEGKAALRASLVAQNAPHRSEKPIYPGVLMDAMNAVLDDRAVVASDVGNCQMWARTFRRIATPESFMQSGVWNAMSYGLPTAIVAKMEFPGRDVVALAGDGAFLMTIGDLPTAAEYGANVLIVILNDGAFGQTFMQQSNIYGHTYGTAFRSPDFAQIAKACGAEGIRVSDPHDVEDALRQGLAATKSRPALVEVMVAQHPYPKL